MVHQATATAADPGSRLIQMSDADDHRTTEARAEGFYWVVFGQNPPEIASWKRGEWWLAGDPKPWHSEAVTVASDRLVFRPRLAPVA